MSRYQHAHAELVFANIFASKSANDCLCIGSLACIKRIDDPFIHILHFVFLIKLLYLTSAIWAEFEMHQDFSLSEFFHLIDLDLVLAHEKARLTYWTL